MPYKIVYTPDGKRMEVAAERAELLILDFGWTQTEPTKPKKKTVKKPKILETTAPDIPLSID